MSFNLAQTEERVIEARAVREGRYLVMGGEMRHELKVEASLNLIHRCEQGQTADNQEYGLGSRGIVESFDRRGECGRQFQGQLVEQSKGGQQQGWSS